MASNRTTLSALNPNDVTSYAIGVGAMAVAALLAIVLPALQAARTEPHVTTRAQ